MTCRTTQKKCVSSSPASSDHYFPTPDIKDTICECGSQKVPYDDNIASRLGAASSSALEDALKYMDHRGGLDDDHYAKLTIQPMDVVESWSIFWRSTYAYYLGEAIHMIARTGTKGQPLRDLKKARWLLDQAIRIQEGKLPVINLPADRKPLI